MGDTINDWHAALRASCRFQGVSYGWEITPEETRFPVSHNAEELRTALLSAF